MLGFVSQLVGGEERRREGELAVNTCYHHHHHYTTSTTTSIVTPARPYNSLSKLPVYARSNGGVSAVVCDSHGRV